MRTLEESLNWSIEETKSILASLNAHISSATLSLRDEAVSTSPPGGATTSVKTPSQLGDESVSASSSLPPAPFPSLQKLRSHRKTEGQLASLGTSTKPVYTPNLHLIS